jgi:ABC-type transport system involved in multi-copper enzyme maturation permease subunit
MNAPNAVLGGVEGALAIAGVAFKRMLRGKALWVVAGMAFLPLLFTAAIPDPTVPKDWGKVISFWGYLLAILPPVLLASAIGEEIEERTMTYLWSRPLPRWSIVGGKVIAILPVLWIVLAAALIAPFYARFPDAGAHGTILARTLAAVVLGTIGVASVTAGLATLAPRYGTVISLGYLVFVDRTLAFFDASISKLSVTYHAIRLTGMWGDAQPLVQSIGWLLGLSAAWMAVAAWRIRRLE